MSSEITSQSTPSTLSPPPANLGSINENLSETDSEQPASRTNLLFGIYVVSFLIFLCMGVHPINTPLFLKETFYDGDERKAALAYSIFVSAESLLNFVFAPFVGALSNKYGRIAMIKLSLIFTFFQHLSFLLNMKIWVLFFTFSVIGVVDTGITAIHGYVSDVSRIEERPKAFGTLTVVIALSFFCSIFMTGVLSQFSLLLPYSFSVWASGTAFFWVVLFVPESLLPENRTEKITMKQTSPLSSIWYLVKTNNKLGIVFILLFDYLLSFKMVTNIWVLYCSYKFGFEGFPSAMSLVCMTISASFSNSFLLKKLIHLGYSPRTIIRFGLGCLVIGCVGMASAISSWEVFLFPLIYGLGTVFFPLTQSLSTSLVDDSKIGLLQGNQTAFGTLAGVVAPLISGSSFRFGTGKYLDFPGLPFLIAGAFYALGFLFTSIYDDGSGHKLQNDNGIDIELEEISSSNTTTPSSSSNSNINGEEMSYSHNIFSDNETNNNEYSLIDK